MRSGLIGRQRPVEQIQFVKRGLASSPWQSSGDGVGSNIPARGDGVEAGLQPDFVMRGQRIDSPRKVAEHLTMGWQHDVNVKVANAGQRGEEVRQRT